MSVSGISYTKAAEALKDGGLILGTFAIPINGLNGVASVCCSDNCSMLSAIGKIYRAQVKKPGQPVEIKQVKNVSPSIFHFGKGMRQYVEKETSRLGFKVLGLSFLKPKLEQYFKSDSHGALKTSLSFSGSLALWEMAIQPYDTWCTQAQTQRVWTKFSDSYVGSTANGMRQFKTWMTFSYVEAYSNHVLSQTNIDPHSPSGIVAKSAPVGFAVTFLCHPEQRLKNHLQIFPEVVHEALTKNRSRYVVGWNHIVSTQGYAGLFRGFVAKGLSNSILAGGAIILLENGRRAAAKKDQPF
jgi:hypothetical protein